MGGKKLRGSEPARGSSFSCRSRRGGDFRSLSQELVGGGDKVAAHIQEFSLFSSLGVTEIAPWLSDENSQNDSHRIHSVGHKHSLLTVNDSACIVEAAIYEDRIKFLEEITRKLDQKVRSLETKHKEKENRNRGDNLYSENLSELKENKDMAVANDVNKDLKLSGGGVNIERFRTLEGRQAFQQSKFSSLDIVFGGSSSSVWSKGCKKLRSLLLNAEDGNQLDERIPMKNTFPTNCSEETKMKAIVRALLSDVDTDTDTDDNENENENASANEKIVSKECESRLGNISAGLRSLSPSPAVFDDRTISISDTSNLESHKDRKVKANSNFPGNGDELIAFNSRSKYISKNDDDNNNDKDREEDNDNNSNNSSHSSNSNKMNKKRNKYKGNDMVKNNVLKLKDIDGPAELIQNSLCSQIEILVGKLNFHMKKIQRHIKYFPKDLLESTSTILNTEYSGKNNIDLWKYWSEIAILIGRFDYLESHFEGKEDKILNSFKDFSIHRNLATVAKDEMKETNSKHHDKRDGGGNYNDNDRKMKEKEKDDNVDMKKRKQLSTRYTCISDKTESDSIITNKCNCGYDYNHDNRAIIYNTRGYPFGYNNHFISGNNYYGYPPPNTQQRDNTNFNMYSDQNRNQNQNQNQNLNLNQTNKNQQQSDKYNSNIQILKNSNYSKSKHNYNSQNNSQNNSNNNFDAQDEIDENLDQNSDALNSSGTSTPQYNQANHPSFDISKDSLPLRYDSPMSPYASYYVYVPVSGTNANSANNHNSNINTNSNISTSGNSNSNSNNNISNSPSMIEVDGKIVKELLN